MRLNWWQLGFPCLLGMQAGTQFAPDSHSGNSHATRFSCVIRLRPFRASRTNASPGGPVQKDLLRRLLIRDEDERTEFKLACHIDKGEKFKNELAKDLVALANSAGRSSKDCAYLVIGAGDK